jgi:hypothetical protein
MKHSPSLSGMKLSKRPALLLKRGWSGRRRHKITPEDAAGVAQSDRFEPHGATRCLPDQIELEEMGGRTGGAGDQAHSAGSGMLSANTTGCQLIRPAVVSSAESSSESDASDWEAGKLSSLLRWLVIESCEPPVASTSTGAARLRPSASAHSTNSQTGLGETPAKLAMTNMIQTVLIQMCHVIVQGIENLPAVFARQDQAQLAQSTHLMRNGGVAETDGLGQRTGVLLTADQHGNDADPAGIAEHVE